VLVAQALVATTALGVAMCAYLVLVGPALDSVAPLWERTALIGLLAAVGRARWSANHQEERSVRRYVVMGPPGCGKGTQATALAARFGSGRWGRTWGVPEAGEAAAAGWAPGGGTMARCSGPRRVRAGRTTDTGIRLAGWPGRTGRGAG
jgi:hypothetical protein